MKYALTSRDGFKSTTFQKVYGATLFSGGRKVGVKYHSRFIRKGTTWCSKLFDTEREAALAYDRKLIELGEQPVNVLKPKPQLCSIPSPSV